MNASMVSPNSLVKSTVLPSAVPNSPNDPNNYYMMPTPGTQISGDGLGLTDIESLLAQWLYERNNSITTLLRGRVDGMRMDQATTDKLNGGMKAFRHILSNLSPNGEGKNLQISTTTAGYNDFVAREAEKMGWSYTQMGNDSWTLKVNPDQREGQLFQKGEAALANIKMDVDRLVTVSQQEQIELGQLTNRLNESWNFLATFVQKWRDAADKTFQKAGG